jgi:hypothetical protein
MTARTWKTSRLGAALAVVAGMSLAGCGPGEPTTDADKLARGKEIVQKMSDRLAAAEVIRVTTTEARDLVRMSGKKEAVSGTGQYTVRRPDRFHTRSSGAREIETWYNGKVLTVAGHKDKIFAQAPMPESINRTLDALAERYDMALPMGDMFYAPVTKALLSDTATGGYVGIENVGDTPCSHLAFKDTGADYELWIPTQGEPLPKRFRLVHKARTGQPVTDIRFDSWDLAPAVADDMFVPKLSAEYEGIAMVQRAAAVKKSAAPADKPAAKQ